MTAPDGDARARRPGGDDRGRVEAERLWQAALDELKLQMTAETFDQWLRGTRGLALADGTLRVAVPNVYAKDWLEHRLRRTIARTLGYMGGGLSVEFLVAPL